ncbi:MAG TPA: cadherin-like domain-containing protein [Myxococcaceae bacterium]|nr:cadherin-like domain-containing protein [Myxococcaceae bacterium]
MVRTRSGNTAAPAVCLALLLGCGSSPGGGGTANHSPVASPKAATEAVVMGASTQLQARASDPDGDALTYSWTQTSPASPQGSFSSASSDSPTWTAPTVLTATPFTLSVSVSDGKGGSTAATVTVYAKVSSDPSFRAEVAPILAACTGCHGGTSPEGLLVLEPNLSYASLVNAPEVTGTCTNLLRVAPGDPDASALVRRMVGETCGLRMPPNDRTYFDQLPGEVALVRTWIQNGAPNN